MEEKALTLWNVLIGTKDSEGCPAQGARVGELAEKNEPGCTGFLALPPPEKHPVCLYNMMSPSSSPSARGAQLSQLGLEE